MAIMAYAVLVSLLICMFVDKVIGLEGGEAFAVAFPFCLLNSFTCRKVVMSILH
jgi:hypothetical protein